MKRSIFEKLDEAQICYAVIVSLISLRSTIEYCFTEYSIITFRKWKPETKKPETKKPETKKPIKLGTDYEGLFIGFNNSKSSYNIQEYILNDCEVDEFKSIMNKFVKVIHNKDGRIYEIKRNSFKKFYDSMKQPVKQDL